MNQTIHACAVTPRGIARVRGGHPWIFAADVARGPEDDRADVVAVTDAKGRVLGTAFYGGRESQLALRMIARGPVPLTVDRAWLTERIRAAVARRGEFAARDAYRVVHGEADQLPGLFVDRYADALVMQTATRAMDAREADLAAALLEAVPGIRRVLSRDDSSIRDLEKLPRRQGVLIGAAGDTRASYHEGPARFEVDLLQDGKTGSYLDQLDNHVRAGELGFGEALDCFTYHGGFALALARRATRVLACDQSAEAIERARANAAANGVGNVRFEVDNAFDLLRRLDSEATGLDTIVLDPPAFAKRKGAPEAAERAYHEINLRALRIIRPGGLLVSCSCSAKMTSERFGDMLEGAASDAGRQVQVLERRGAGADHPGLLGVPETEYLKCWFMRVL